MYPDREFRYCLFLSLAQTLFAQIEVELRPFYDILSLLSILPSIGIISLLIRGLHVKPFIHNDSLY